MVTTARKVFRLAPALSRGRHVLPLLLTDSALRGRSIAWRILRATGGADESGHESRVPTWRLAKLRLAKLGRVEPKHNRKERGPAQPAPRAGLAHGPEPAVGIEAYVLDPDRN